MTEHAAANFAANEREQAYQIFCRESSMHRDALANQDDEGAVPPPKRTRVTRTGATIINRGSPFDESPTSFTKEEARVLPVPFVA
jgi:hypothetical protein